jgi:predicted 3-demethylubiquinone-9 3-methyltransferase (glyoxalase superfamily)
MRKITPHLWFDKEAKEAAGFYTTVFKDSKIQNATTLDNTPSGSVDIVSIQLMGKDFMLISAGPLFKFTPAVSFIVSLKTKDEVNALWGKLIEKGKALMELGKYPFSERYGWVIDRFGLSWQIGFFGECEQISPSLMFVGDICGKAEEAVKFYTSIFHNSKIYEVFRYEKGETPDKEGTIKYASFTLEGNPFSAMDSAHGNGFAFNEAISFLVYCENQKEIDYFWEKLSADPKAEMCGWLKDRYGLSWQIVPTVMDEMMQDTNKKKVQAVTEAFLQMKKFDLEKLKQAYGEA